MDGIDAALIRWHPAASLPCTLVASATYSWDRQLRKQLLTLSQGHNVVSLDVLGQLDAQVGLVFADAANALIESAKIDRKQIAAIGSHGQTIRHRPQGQWGFSWQMGDGNRLSEATGITTIGDFRRRDIAVGGQGAPLMPSFHARLFQTTREDRAVLNLGGIANLTFLPATGRVFGFDTGPANALMDSWYQLHHGGEYDPQGQMAAAGRLCTTLLHRLLRDPWFATPPPKSTGREYFHLGWLRGALMDLVLPAADIQATLLELTVASIVDALTTYQPSTRRVFVCGGGVHNCALMRRLSVSLPEIKIDSTDIAGISPDYLEAMGFAWLAAQTLNYQPGNLPDVTGAREPRILGAIYPATILS